MSRTSSEECRRIPDVTFVDMLAALFEYAPPPPGEAGWTGVQVCERARRRRRRLSETGLSMVRRGIIATPAWDIVVTLADIFGVRVDFFTLDYHHCHAHASMRDRVFLARNDYPHLLHLAASLQQLPPEYRDTLLTLVDVLAAPAASTHGPHDY